MARNTILINQSGFGLVCLAVQSFFLSIGPCNYRPQRRRRRRTYGGNELLLWSGDVCDKATTKPEEGGDGDNSLIACDPIGS